MIYTFSILPLAHHSLETGAAVEKVRQLATQPIVAEVGLLEVLEPGKTDWQRALEGIVEEIEVLQVDELTDALGDAAAQVIRGQIKKLQ